MVHFGAAQEYIREHKPVPIHYLARGRRKRLREDRTGIREGVELSGLAAWIDTRRKVCQQPPIEYAACKGGRKAARIDACNYSAQPAVYHLLGERAGRSAPQREQRRETGLRKLPLPIGANVLQE